MCDHHGGYAGTGSVPGSIDRRAFLRGGAAGAIAVGLPLGILGGMPSAHAAATFKGTHGSGFCNSAFFITHARQLGKEYGLTLEFVNTPTFAEMVTFFGAGMVDVSVLPYTSFIGLYDKGAPVKIVGGGGIEGCVIVAQPGLDTPAKLKGKTLGTFQMDTLEVLPYDWLKKNGVAFSEITVRYMGNTPEAVEAFKAGALDFILHDRALRLGSLKRRQGLGHDVKRRRHLRPALHRLRAGGAQQPDRAAPGRSEGADQGDAESPAAVRAAAQRDPRRDYKTSLENARIGAQKQPPCVDQRAQTDFILGRVESIIEMGYIKNKPGHDAIDWTFLEQAIKEVPEVYSQLNYKAA
jgi:NitT/TauT family transport system substrate-binding protein